MTEQTIAETNSGNQNMGSSVNTPAPSVSHETPSEKVFRQEQVDNIAKGARLDGYKKGREEALAEYQKQYPQAQSQPISQPTQQPQQVAQPTSMGGMTQPSAADIDKLIDQRFEQRQLQTDINNFAMNFQRKVEQGYQKYSDFGDVLRDVNPVELAKSNPGFVLALGNTDNPHDILKDLRDKPQNLAALLQLSANPATQAVAQKQLQALSDSIKQNESAANQKNANEPLSHIKPSTTGTDNGSLGLRDLKKQSWMRT